MRPTGVLNRIPTALLYIILFSKLLSLSTLFFGAFDINESEADLTEKIDDLKRAILNVNKQGV